MSVLETFTKDPDAELDYEVDWTDWLGADTIDSVEWVVPTGLTQPYAASNTTVKATVWLAGGTAGTSYDVVCRITTAAGRIDDRTIRIKVKEK